MHEMLYPNSGYIGNSDMPAPEDCRGFAERLLRTAETLRRGLYEYGKALPRHEAGMPDSTLPKITVGGCPENSIPELPRG